MPNLITRYDNGTFEGSQAGWDEEYGSGTTAQVQDPTFFKEGANSVKMTTADISTPGGFGFGEAQLMVVRFPATIGQSYKLSLWVKCSAGIPDDAVFFLSAAAIDTTKDGYVIPVRAGSAKGDFVELVAYFFAGNVWSGETYFTLNVMWNTLEFSELLDSNQPLKEYFSNLLNFTAETPIPAGEFVWADFAVSEVSSIPVQPDLQFDGRRLYYIENVFYIEVDGVRTIIEEPIKWDQVTIQIIFDEKTKAYRFEFSDKDVMLEFDNRAGRALLSQLYKQKGVNADARLLFGEFDTISNALTIHYEGSINFEDCEENEKTFKANIERQSFGEKLRTYFDTRVDLFRPTSLGGLSRPALTLNELFLHPRLLSYKAEYIYNQNVSPFQTLDPQDFSPAVGDTGTVYVSIPPFMFTTNNIDGLSEPIAPDGFLIYSGLSFSPGITKRKFYIECGLSFRYTKTGSVQAPLAGFGIIKISNFSSNPSTSGIPITPFNSLSYTDTGGILAGTNTVTGQFNGTIELGPDEALFFRTTIYNQVAGSPDTVYSDFEYLNTTSHFLRIQEQTVFAPSLMKAPLIHEIVNRQLELILDKVNVLKSNFLGRTDIGYGSNGCAAFHLGMDGKMIRNFVGKAFNISAKDWYNSLDALFCMGMSIERDSLENESVRFEPIQYFFRNTLLLNLSVISKYSRKPASKYLFSEVGAAFTKYPQDNQQDSIEDFHTMMGYITPLITIKNKLNLIIDAILSGYYIEYTRQESFRTNPTNAYETDNNLFYISARKAEGQHTGVSITAVSSTRTITIFKLIPVIPTDIVYIYATTGTVVLGQYVVQNVEIPFTYDRVILTVELSMPDATGTGSIDILSASPFGLINRYEAKRDEDFDTITGVAYPKSVYNLEHHIKRIVIRWAKVFQSGWAFLLEGATFSTAALRFNEGRNNTEARTQLKSSVTCKYGDSVNEDRKDSAFEAIINLDKPLFDKDEISFEAPLTWTSFNYIRFAFEGRNPDGRDYGYIQFKNPDGETERGFVISMKFDPNKQNCKFTLIKKYDG